MGLILTATAGLCLWIVLWALNIKAIDGMLIVIAMVLVALGIRNVIALLPRRRD
jgi:hypothetical protein